MLKHHVETFLLHELADLLQSFLYVPIKQHRARITTQHWYSISELLKTVFSTNLDK